MRQISSSFSSTLSIVIPCYNCQSTIARLIESIRRQTVPVGWDVNFIDDHSIDHTVSTILSHIAPEAFKPADPRFNLLTNPSKGAGSARNYGMRWSAGQYLWFIDSDDYIASPRAFETLLGTIRSNPDVDMFIVNCATVDGVGRKDNASFTELRTKPELYGRVLANDDFVKDFDSLYSVIGFPPWNKVVRRQFLEENGIEFQNTLFCNDQYFSIRCMTEAQKFFMMSGAPLYCWSTAGRFHTSNSMLKKRRPDQYEIILKALDQKCKWPNAEIRKKILEDRSIRFNCDVLKKSGRLS